MTFAPLAESFLHQRHRMMGDHGAFMGRSTRTTWAPCWQLSHVGRPIMLQGDKVQKMMAMQREEEMMRMRSRFSIMPRSPEHLNRSVLMEDGGFGDGMQAVVMEQLIVQPQGLDKEMVRESKIIHFTIPLTSLLNAMLLQC